MIRTTAVAILVAFAATAQAAEQASDIAARMIGRLVLTNAQLQERVEVLTEEKAALEKAADGSPPAAVVPGPGGRPSVIKPPPQAPAEQAPTMPPPTVMPNIPPPPTANEPPAE